MDDLDAGMSWDDFTTYVNGLPVDAVWRQITANEPIDVSGDDADRLIDSL